MARIRAVRFFAAAGEAWGTAKSLHFLEVIVASSWNA
jgi:hypothetical protein